MTNDRTSTPLARAGILHWLLGTGDMASGGAVMVSPDPGPWRQEPGTPLVYSHDGSLVANCTKTTNVCLANARLIAAAPQMLEALKAILEQTLEILGPLDTRLNDSLDDVPSIKNARVAIAAAEAGDD